MMNVHSGQPHQNNHINCVISLYQTARVPGDVHGLTGAPQASTSPVKWHNFMKMYNQKRLPNKYRQSLFGVETG